MSRITDLTAGTPQNDDVFVFDGANGTKKVAKSDLLGGFADKASSPTAGDLASLDANGSPTDSGIKASDVSAHLNSQQNPHNVTADQIGAVPNTRTVNGKALSSNITLDAEDVGAPTTEAVEIALANKANIDGYYENMGVGNAEQLIATVAVEDKAPYNFRTSGGSASIGDRAQNKIVGGTYAWNQLVQNGNFESTSGWSAYKCSVSTANNKLTATILDDPNDSVNVYRSNFGGLVSGHKYLMCGTFTPSVATTIQLRLGGSVFATKAVGANTKTLVCGVSSVTLNNLYLYQYINVNNEMSAGDTVVVENMMVFDLTLAFGSAIADYIYQLEQGTAGAGVAWFRKLFPLSYYPYAEGGLESVNAGSYKTTGFNQFDKSTAVADERWNAGGTATASGTTRSDYIKCLPNTAYYFKNVHGSATMAAVYWYDASKTLISYSIIDGTSPRSGLLTSPDNAAYMGVNMPSASVDECCVNLSWNGSHNGEYEPYTLHDYPLDSSLTLRGIPKLDASNNLYYNGDEYNADGTVKRRYGVVDLGTLTWSTSTITGVSVFVTSNGVIPAKASNNTSPNTISARWEWHRNTQFGSGDKFIVIDANSRIIVRDSSYSDLQTFTASLSGVMLVYELAKPTEETAEPFQSPAIVNDWGTETFTDASYEAGTRAMEIPVGHVTEYPENLRDKVQNSPAPSDSGDGLYNVRQVNGKLSLEADTAPGRLTALEAKLPAPPAADGAYTLHVTVSDGTPTYSWS